MNRRLSVAGDAYQEPSYWLETGSYAYEYVLGRSEEPILRIRGGIGYRLHKLLSDVQSEKLNTWHFDCHDVAEYLLCGLPIGARTETPRRGWQLSLEEAIDQLALPCGIQMYGTDKDEGWSIIHSGVLLGRNKESVPLIFHKKGCGRMQICSYDEMIKSYREQIEMVTFHSSWKTPFRSLVSRWINALRIPQA